ncbi:MAG: hypothetical protein K2K81_07465 [Muribaculaceae bacterium]|nr:hypothetical protein [Muribaculaceae bacterium]
MARNTFAKSQSSTTERAYSSRGSCKWILALFFLILFPQTSLAASITFDFRKLYTEESREDLTSADLLKYLNSEEVSPGLVQAIPYCSQAYGYSKGLRSNNAYTDALNLSDYGALFINSTDAETREDTGGITFKLNPRYLHRFTKLTVHVYLDDLIVTEHIDPKLEVSINGGAFQDCEFTSRNPKHIGYFTIDINEIIVKELSLKIPNAYRKNGTLGENEALYKYYMAITRVLLGYNDDTPEKVTGWHFSETTHEGYLNDEKPYVMPSFTAIPSAAADMMELSSSSPEVADVEDGQVVLKKEGVATIAASLAENSLFIPSDSYSPATYELTVKNSMSTAIELVRADENKEGATLYDLQGRLITGTAVPGVYILKSGHNTKKVIIR